MQGDAGVVVLDIAEIVHSFGGIGDHFLDGGGLAEAHQLQGVDACGGLQHPVFLLEVLGGLLQALIQGMAAVKLQHGVAAAHVEDGHVDGVGRLQTLGLVPDSLDFLLQPEHIGQLVAVVHVGHLLDSHHVAAAHIVAVVHDADDEEHDEEQGGGGEQRIVVNHPAGGEAVAHISALLDDDILGEIGGQVGDFLVHDAPETRVGVLAHAQADVLPVEALGEGFQIVGEGPFHQVGHHRPGGVGHISPAIAHGPETFFQGVAVDNLPGAVVVFHGNHGGEGFLDDCHLGIIRQGEALADDGGVVDGAVGLGGRELQFFQPGEVAGHICHEIHCAAGNVLPDAAQGTSVHNLYLDAQVFLYPLEQGGGDPLPFAGFLVLVEEGLVGGVDCHPESLLLLQVSFFVRGQHQGQAAGPLVLVAQAVADIGLIHEQPVHGVVHPVEQIFPVSPDQQPVAHPVKQGDDPAYSRSAQHGGYVAVQMAGDEAGPHGSKVMEGHQLIGEGIFYGHLGQAGDGVAVVDHANLQMAVAQIFMEDELHGETGDDMVGSAGVGHSGCVARHGRQQVNLPRLELGHGLPPVDAGDVGEVPPAEAGEKFHVLIALADEMPRAVFLQEACARHIAHLQSFLRCFPPGGQAAEEGQEQSQDCTTVFSHENPSLRSIEVMDILPKSRRI